MDLCRGIENHPRRASYGSIGRFLRFGTRGSRATDRRTGKTTGHRACLRGLQFRRYRGGPAGPPRRKFKFGGNVIPHAADRDVGGYRPPDVLYSIGLKFPSRKGMRKRSACKISIRAKWWPKRFGRSPAFIKTALFTSPTRYNRVDDR